MKLLAVLMYLMQCKRKRRITLLSLLVLFVIFIMPLEWVGVPREEMRFMFDSDINARLAANQSQIQTPHNGPTLIFDDLSALTEASQHTY